MELVGIVAILIAFAMMVGFGLVSVAVLMHIIKLGAPKGHRTPTERFVEAADRLHRLVHPDEEGRGS